MDNFFNELSKIFKENSEKYYNEKTGDKIKFKFVDLDDVLRKEKNNNTEEKK